MFGLFKTQRVSETSVSELKQQLNSLNPPVLIDVRTREEFSSGAISKKAKNISITSFNFNDEIQKLDKNATYVVYCRSGNRSAAACKVMMNLGFKNVSNLNGGIIAWGRV